MKPILEQDYQLRALDVDLNGTWRPSAILTRLQEIAEDHAVVLNCGRKKLVEEQNIAWMLTRIHVKMLRYPKICDNIRVVTWPAQPTRLYFIRYSMFYDEAGEVLGTASSQWVLFHMKERCLCRPANVDLGDYTVDESLVPPIDAPGKIHFPEQMEHKATREVLYSQTDMNRHMNNARYADWVCELFDHETLSKRQVDTLRINYVQEMMMGQQVELQYAEQDGVHYVCGKSDDKVTFEASLTWK